MEHDVSIISALQLMAALEPSHRPTPIYLDREGRFWTGDLLRDIGSFAEAIYTEAEPVELRLGGDSGAFILPARFRIAREKPLEVDVALCAIHGTGGEDGALLGFLQLAGIPFAGGGLGPAAAAMNKSTAKAIFSKAGIRVNPEQLFSRREFDQDKDRVVEGTMADTGLPCYVKPCSLGSSVGVARCDSREALRDALALCFELDQYAIIEPALDDAMEINCAVLGGSQGSLTPSVCEQPLKHDSHMLGFEQKYMQSGSKPGGKHGSSDRSSKGSKTGMASQGRIIPAPIADALTQEIQKTALTAHQALGFAGVVRYDFLVGDDEGVPSIVLNEANTVPGSFAYYLFEPVGLTFPELACDLVELALIEASEESKTTRSFSSMLLQSHAQGAKA